ncbi:hypothetical protein EVAR_98775_1 [Eumeta japonica]|uniref:Uncharacterized protein n=1 Tax=Eumeta variegata TaxID=151549 RepID=A0A4C1YWC8_EUMVA|nr:hypothetical protein EVAR_98775_1 [Eumeta japonica]
MTNCPLTGRNGRDVAGPPRALARAGAGAPSPTTARWLRLGVTLKSVTLGNVTMSHRTREARRMPCVSLPLNYDRSAARAARISA